MMVDDAQLWSLLAGIEERLPLRPETLQAFFGATFEKSRDHNRQPILVATTSTSEMELSAGSLTVRFTPPLQVSSAAVYQRFPGGNSLPPPPPGYGPAGAEAAYIATRPWGQIWFKFFTGSRLTQVSIAPGTRPSPGV